MKKVWLCSALFCSMLGANAAQAAVIDFNADPTSHYGNGNPYQEDGFALSNSFNNDSGQLFWGNTDPSWIAYNADPGGNTFSHNYSNSTTTLTKMGGGLFDFNRIDLGDVYNAPVGGDVQFNFLFGNASTSATVVSLDSLVGLQTFTFNLLGLQQVSWTPLTTQGPWLQLDNIVVDASVAPVPVPAAIWLFASGLIGLLGRRKQTA